MPNGETRPLKHTHTGLQPVKQTNEAGVAVKVITMTIPASSSR